MAGLNSVFSFWLPFQAKELGLLFTHSWERNYVFMPFSTALALSKTQTASSRLWTWVNDSISYDNNSHAKHAYWRAICNSSEN